MISAARTNKPPRGFTLIEIVMVLAIAAIVMGGAVGLMVYSSDERVLRNASGEIELLAKRARTIAILQQTPYALEFREGVVRLLPLAASRAWMRRKPSAATASAANRSSRTGGERRQINLEGGMEVFIRRWNSDEWLRHRQEHRPRLALRSGRPLRTDFRPAHPRQKLGGRHLPPAHRHHPRQPARSPMNRPVHPVKRGFLLLEMVLALAVFGIAATGFAVALHRMADVAALAQSELRITRILDSALDETLSLPVLEEGDDQHPRSAKPASNSITTIELHRGAGKRGRPDPSGNVSHRNRSQVV